MLALLNLRVNSFLDPNMFVFLSLVFFMMLHMQWLDGFTDIGSNNLGSKDKGSNDLESNDLGSKDNGSNDISGQSAAARKGYGSSTVAS